MKNKLILYLLVFFSIGVVFLVSLLFFGDKFTKEAFGSPDPGCPSCLCNVCPDASPCPAVCTRADPTVSISPDSQSGNPGDTLTYTITVTNNDNAACGASDFDLTRSCPGGWTCSLATASLNILPGASGSTTISVTSPAVAVAGDYTFTVTATNHGAPAYSGTDSATYTVEALPVTWPHVSITAPASVTENTDFSVSLTYTHDGGEVGGIHLRWLDSEFDVPDPAGCTVYDNPAFAPGWEGLECYLVPDGTTTTFTLRGLTTGTNTLYHRAWDETQDYDCGGGKFDYNRDPSSGSCSANCDPSGFPGLWEVCNAYSKDITVTAPICTCNAWVNDACGAGGCTADKMHQTRTCNPPGCDIESQCVNDSCTPWTDDACGPTGGCVLGEMHQTRGCTYGCLPESQCILDLACCACTPWADDACGPAGGCVLGEMHQTRGCNPPGCDSESQCVLDPACVAFEFELSNSGDIEVWQGESGANTIYVDLITGAPEAVTLSAALPAAATDATADFIPDNACTPDDECLRILRISTADTTPLGEYDITVTGTDGGTSETTTFKLFVLEKIPPLPPPPKCTAVLDIVFAIDSTGSMGGVIDKAKEQAGDIMTGIETALADYNPDIQYGVIDLRDYDDGAPWPYIFRSSDPETDLLLTKDKTEIENALNDIGPGGGGDCPEAYSRVMYESYNSLDDIGYRSEAARILLMMGDDLPHDKAKELGVEGRLGFDSHYIDPYFDIIAKKSTDDILDEMTINGITLLALIAPTNCAGENFNFMSEVDWPGNNWNTWAEKTGGSAYAIAAAPADLVNVIVKSVVRAIFDKDGDGFMTMDCPCDPENLPPGIDNCYDCDDDRFDAMAALAWECLFGGLVPCGRLVNDPSTVIDETAPCTLCHFFVLFKRVVDYVTVNIIFPLAVLMFVVGGIMLLTATGDPEKIRGAKKILKAVVIGLVIMLAAWLIVNTVIVFITPADSPFQPWHTINCPFCGDGICGPGETPENCPFDCP